MKGKDPQLPENAPPTRYRPRTKPPEVRRKELLNAAQWLFLRKGVAATSVDDIVAAADVAKGTFYLHFESREQLLTALQQRFVASFCQTLQTAMEQRPADDWPGRLRAWIEAGVGSYLDRVALHDVVFHQFRPADPRAKHDNPVVNALAELLLRGTQAGAWSVENPPLTAVMLFGAFHAAVDDAIAAKTEIDRVRVADVLEAFFRRAVSLG